MDDDDRKPNPRNLGYFSDQRVKTTSAAPDLAAQKPTPPILDRFRAMLREREEEVGLTDGDIGSSIPVEDVVRLYEEVLSELTFNSKPIITELTIIAGEQSQCAEGIAEAICARILEVPVEQKLPSLYLLDSIVKNIGGDYVRYFAARLPQVFCEAYKKVHPHLHPAMHHLFGTWSAVFPNSVLRRLEREIQFSPPVTRQPSNITSLEPSKLPSPRPGHGIHVNPKYLEQQQFEQETADAQHGKGLSSSLQAYGRKPTIGYSEDDFKHADMLPLQKVGSGRVEPPQILSGHPSTVVATESPLTKSKAMLMRLSSPPSIELSMPSSPAAGRLVRDMSPASAVDRISPDSRPGLRNGERNGWWETYWSEDGTQQRESSSSYQISNGNSQRQQRGLIDSYGNYRAKGILPDKSPMVEQLDVNAINNSAATRNWQNVEEEEYDWEDMSPTLADRSRGNDLPGPIHGSLGVNTGSGRPHSDLQPRSRDWSSHAYLPFADDSSTIFDDRVPLTGSARGPLGKMSSTAGLKNELLSKYGRSGYPQDSWKLPHSSSQPSVPYVLPKSGTNASMPFPAADGVTLTTQKAPLSIENPQDLDLAIDRILNVRKRNASSNLDSLHLKGGPALKKHFTQGPHLPPITSMTTPPMAGSHHLAPSVPSPLHQKHHFVNQGLNKSLLDSVDRNMIHSTEQIPWSHRQARPISLSQPNQAQEYLVPDHALVSSHIVKQSLNHSATILGQGAIQKMMVPNLYSGISSSMAANRIPETSLQLHGGAGPPLPLGPLPLLSQSGLMSENAASVVANPPGNAFSGLISSLVAQGLISLTAPASQDSLGVEFNVELLKVRHESAINALYADLPRQCTTCGMRFKCQEEHSSHMDWHVTKNRMSKNQKHNPSRKWFVSAKEWLSGAEALGTDMAPGFLRTETVVEKRVDEEVAVPADENQNVCALCGEPFEDFYSDETEEWMYKGAIYMNAPDGSVEGIDRATLGPIVHVKCRSESTAIPLEDFVKDEGVVRFDSTGSTAKLWRLNCMIGMERGESGDRGGDRLVQFSSLGLAFRPGRGTWSG
ncbi:polyadenylation and cleavage factor homolog 4-like [Aristolochia californica]|uniref:polyadenylation and cleavage factor homolog 4-like n=1 Tax=Aristolochia californica TaxID=171875 RepID=UPI0035D9346B